MPGTGASLRAEAEGGDGDAAAVEDLERLDETLAGLAEEVVLGHEAIPERVVESKDIDPENEAALKAMLDEVFKGD